MFRTHNTMSNRMSEHGSYLFLYCGNYAFTVSPLNMMLVGGFSLIGFFRLRNLFSIPSLLRVFFFFFFFWTVPHSLWDLNSPTRD